MNNNTLYTLLFVIMLLTACSRTQPNTQSSAGPTGAVVAETLPDAPQSAPATEPPQTKETPPQKPQETTQPAETPPAPVESKILVEKSRAFSQELRDLLQKADTSVKSLSYVYSISPENNGFDTYFIKGTRIKIQLFENNDYVIDDYFNVVYLNSVEKTAQGRCENKARCLSKTIDNTHRTYTLSYDYYRTKTPYEWIKDIEYAEIIGQETINNHAVTKIKSEQDNTITEMWVDTRYGIPHRIKVTQPNGKETTYYFKNLQFNTIRDSDVTFKP